MRKIIYTLLCISFLTACGDKKNKDYLVKIKTSYGEMIVLLYNETPLHKENFLELARSGRYDSTVFHRIMDQFMIQGGDVARKEGVAEKEEDRIPAEIVEGFYHVRGALAAARQGDQFNPEKKSSSTQFYIVDGNSWESLSTDINTLYAKMTELLQDTTNRELIEEYKAVYMERDQKKIMDYLFSKKSMVEERFGISLDKTAGTSDDEAYKQAGGGYPPLDGAYTVFGRVVEGLDVMDKISNIPTVRNPQTGENSKPTEDVYVTMEVIEMKKKQVTEKYGYEYPD